MARSPHTIRFEDHVYRKVTADFGDNVQAISTGLDKAIVSFDKFMTLHQEGNTPKALPVLIPVFDGAYSAAQACRSIFDELTRQKKTASPQKVRYQGRVYTAVHHPSESLQVHDAARECQVADAHLTSIVKDASIVAQRAQELLAALGVLQEQAGKALTRHPDALAPGEVDALEPETRVEQFKDPLRALDKANRSLNYTVDAATTAIRVVLDQVDTMVDGDDARLESQMAPHPSKELTKPMLMSDNPSAVFDELGGL